MALGELVANGNLFIALPIALLAGLVSFASPCVLPLVPGYLGYVSGFAGGASGSGARGTDQSGTVTVSRTRLLLGVSLFVLGFTVVFVLIVLTSSVAGFFLVRWSDLITRIAGALVIVMGLVFIGQFTFLQRSFRPGWSIATGLGGAPLLGAAFGLGWAPCIGPTLAVVLSLSLDDASVGRGLLLGIAYSLGLGIPFLLVALGLGWVTGSVAWLRRNIRAVNVFGGVMLIVVGVLMLTGIWQLALGSMQGVIGGFVPAL